EVDQDRAGPARRRQVERLVDDVRDLVGGGDQIGVLGAVHRQAGGVGLLEGVASDGGGADLPGDGHQRGGVHLGVLEGGDQVGGAGTRGGEHDADPAGGHGVALCHVAGALLVTDRKSTRLNSSHVKISYAVT